MIEYQSLTCYRIYSYDVGEQKSNSETGQYSNLYICNVNFILVAVVYFGYEFNIIIEFGFARFHSLIARSCTRSAVWHVLF